MLLAAALGPVLAAAATVGPGGPGLVLHVMPPGHQLTQGLSADGSASAPFSSVVGARDALRALQPLPTGGATVLLHEGHHTPFALDGEADSGRAGAPIVYAAAPGERRVISDCHFRNTATENRI